MPYFCHYDCLLSCLSDVFVYMIFHSAKWLQKNSRICKKIPTKHPRTKAVRGCVMILCICFQRRKLFERDVKGGVFVSKMIA